MNIKHNPTPLPFPEFVALMASMTSLVALTIDAMLPALAEIGEALGTEHENDRQLIIAVVFLGMALGQMLYGPLSDTTGRKPTLTALSCLTLLSILFYGFCFASGGHPTLWWLTAYFIAAFACIGTLFGNLNALAMQPLGHIAGIGASVVGSLSTLIAIPCGIFIGRSYSGTVLPLVGGFAVCAGLALILMLVIDPYSPANRSPAATE